MMSKGISASSFGEDSERFNPSTYIQTARELGYPEAVLSELAHCKNHIQAGIVMKGARHGEYDQCRK